MDHFIEILVGGVVGFTCVCLCYLPFMLQSRLDDMNVYLQHIEEELYRMNEIKLKELRRN